MFRTILLLILVISSALAGESAPPHPFLSTQTAKVLELVLSQIVEGKDARVVLYQREGVFYHGYVEAPVGLGEHWVDTSPVAPFGYFFKGKDGAPDRPFEKGDYAAIKGSYAYKNAAYQPYRKAFEKGEAYAKSLTVIPPLTQTGETISGTCDLMFLNGDGGEHGYAMEIRRVQLTAVPLGGKGTYTSWTYNRKDRDLKQEEGSAVEGACTVRWIDDHWQPKAGSELAAGSDWPTLRGPFGNNTATPCARPLIDDMQQARRLWVSEEVIPAGRSGRRNEIDPNPANDFTLGNGQYAAPIVVDGVVYLYVQWPDPAKLMPEHEVLMVRGAPREWAPRGYLDAFLAIDARTGRTLWKRTLPGPSKPFSGKGGRGMTMAWHDGRVFGRTSDGVIAFEAKTGKELWRKDRLGLGTTIWSHDCSVTVIGDVVLVRSDGTKGTLLALDPATGQERWKQERATCFNSVAIPATLDGKTYILGVYGPYTLGDIQDGQQRMVLLDPSDGRLLWEHKAGVGFTGTAPLVLGDLVLCNGDPDPRYETVRPGKVACFRITAQGATALWTDTFPYTTIRGTPLATADRFFLDSPRHPFKGWLAKDGTAIKELPNTYEQFGGDHNWSWMLGTNDRIISKGVAMFDAKTMELMGKPLRVPVASGYWCPVQPCIADGRLFLRSSSALTCYDLRKP